jgi:CheY-like chemotaxis protein
MGIVLLNTWYSNGTVFGLGMKHASRSRTQYGEQEPQGEFSFLPSSRESRVNGKLMNPPRATSDERIEPRRSTLFDKLIDPPNRASRAKPQGAAEVQAPETQLELISFMIVDDVIPSCHVAHTILRSLGIPASQIHTATSLTDALRILRSTPLNMIISDLNLKDGSGLDLLHTVRRDSETRHMPFVMVTNTPDAQDVAEAKRLGVSSCLVKPLSVTSLEEHIEYALRVRNPKHHTMNVKGLKD